MTSSAARLNNSYNASSVQQKWCSLVIRVRSSLWHYQGTTCKKISGRFFGLLIPYTVSSSGITVKAFLRACFAFDSKSWPFFILHNIDRDESPWETSFIILLLWRKGEKKSSKVRGATSWLLSYHHFWSRIYIYVFILTHNLKLLIAERMSSDCKFWILGVLIELSSGHFDSCCSVKLSAVSGSI